ncbi:MAG: HlyC/CorC family transporter [Verrucomicrobiae bacterium]|nr:HlyC/CorC family transporter [Verrucomicrobiae bacterium]
MVAVPILVALAGMGFFCAVAETALFSLGRWRLREWQGEKGGKGVSARLMQRPEELLAALSLMNTLANGMVVVTCLVVATSRGWSVWMTLAGAFLGVLVVGEVLPKTLAVRSPERWSARVAPAVALLVRITGPLRRIAQRLIDLVLARFAPGMVQGAPTTDEEYREMLEVAVQQGALGSSEKEIIGELISLDRKRARDVLRPRTTMAAVSDDLSLEELVAEARRWRHRRLPVYDESPDTIVGVLDTRRFLLDPAHQLEDAMEFPSFVPETMNLLRLFQSLQGQQKSLAFAVDEFGAVAGVVRMEDILAEVLGPMSGDAANRGFVFEKLGPGRWRVSGTMRLEDFRREHPALPEMGEVATLGGLLMTELSIVPRPGESAVVGGLRLTAQLVDERQVHELLVERVGGR